MTAAHGGGQSADVLALVRRENPDVVVLDATDCEEGVERLVPALADDLPRVGVVVVCEHSTTAAQRIGALPKWGWTQDLRRAVERAYDDRGRRIRVRRPAAIPRAAGPLAGWD
jgi:DNA-binding NtrC family response regulator